MHSTLRSLACLAILAPSSDALGHEAASDLYAVKIRQLKDGIYVAYRPEPLRYFVEGNVTIIVNENDVVLVDGGGAPAAARNVIAENRRLTRNPVRYLVNTHDHVDHTLGNQEYVKAYPGVEIVAHPVAREHLLGDVMRLLQAVQDQVRAAIADGLDLEGTRKRVDLSSLVDEFSQGDPVIRYRFRGWFIDPNVEETFRVLKQAPPK